MKFCQASLLKQLLNGAIVPKFSHFFTTTHISIAFAFFSVSCIKKSKNLSEQNNQAEDPVFEDKFRKILGTGLDTPVVFEESFAVNSKNDFKIESDCGDLEIKSHPEDSIGVKIETSSVQDSRTALYVEKLKANKTEPERLWINVSCAHALRENLGEHKGSQPFNFSRNGASITNIVVENGSISSMGNVDGDNLTITGNKVFVGGQDLTDEIIKASKVTQFDARAKLKTTLSLPAQLVKSLRIEKEGLGNLSLTGPFLNETGDAREVVVKSNKANFAIGEMGDFVFQEMAGQKFNLLGQSKNVSFKGNKFQIAEIDSEGNITAQGNFGALYLSNFKEKIDVVEHGVFEQSQLTGAAKGLLCIRSTRGQITVKSEKTVGVYAKLLKPAEGTLTSAFPNSPESMAACKLTFPDNY
jgi:hypothetical protein